MAWQQMSVKDNNVKIRKGFRKHLVLTLCKMSSTIYLCNYRGKMMQPKMSKEKVEAQSKRMFDRKIMVEFMSGQKESEVCRKRR